MDLALIPTDALKAELLSREIVDTRLKVGSPEAIAAYLRPYYAECVREEFHVLYLNTRNTILDHKIVSVGSVDQCHVDPREVFAPAVACRATGIILSHNHPSGDPEPSVQDVQLTRQLRDSAKLLCMSVLDHVVMGANGAYVSLLNRGLLTPASR